MSVLAISTYLRQSLMCNFHLSDLEENTSLVRKNEQLKTRDRTCVVRKSSRFSLFFSFLLVQGEIQLAAKINEFFSFSCYLFKKKCISKMRIDSKHFRKIICIWHLTERY